MIKTLTGKDAHPYGISLAACIESHLNNPTTEVQLPLDTFESRYKDAINDTIDHQKQIGWQHLVIRGFLHSLGFASHPSNLSKMANWIRQKDNTASIHPSRRFTSTSAPSGWAVVTHSTNTRIANALKYSAESTEIRHYFSDPILLPAEDRHYVSNNLAKLLRSSPSVRRRWLRRVRTARHNMLKHGNHSSPLGHSSLRQCPLI